MMSGTVETGRTDVIVSGRAAASIEVRDRFWRELSLPIHSVDDLDSSTLLGKNGHHWVRQATCVAMLLGEMPAQPVALLNFRLGEFAFFFNDAAPAEIYTSAFIGAAMGLLVIVHLILGIATSRH